MTDVDLVTLQPGQAIGRYSVVSVLGQGGFGITYRAVDTELGRHVAIKEYLPAALAVRKDGVTVVPRSQGAAADLAWGLDRFVAEGRTLAALHRAPGIVNVHDYLRANGTAYLVMELLDGETLHDRLSRGPLDAAAVERLLAPLLDGLERVHAAGFLHRDIKPANILLDANGAPTLIDFGASRAAVAGRSQAMTAVFTPGYAPVEQFTSAPQGAWTDIYALAATLHHAIAGAPPPNAVDRMLDDTLAPLATSGRPFPRALLAGIDAALAVRAADRPQSVAAWRALLAGTPAPAATVIMPGKASAPSMVSPAPPTAAPSAPPTAPAPAPVLRKGPGVKIAAGVALLLVATGGWFALGGASAPSTPPAPPASAVVAAAPAAQDRAQQELEQARRQQRAAEEEAAKLRAEAEARRRADGEAALRARIEQEMRDKAAADEAARRQAAEEAKRQADAEAAARAAAEAAAKAKADAEAAAKVQEEAAAPLRAEEADRKGAEAAETALRLGPADRQRVQVALTSLGFATGGTDGVFGARSREMIAAWQKKAGRAATGYLTQDQQAALLHEAAPALARYDEEQRKIAQATPSATPSATSPVTTSPSPGGGQCEGTFRSQWCRAAYQGFPPSCWPGSMTVRNGEVSDGWVSSGDSGRRNVVTGRIDGAGNVTLQLDGIGAQTHVNQRFVAQLSGKVANGVLTAAGRAGTTGREFNVTVRCR